VCADNQLTHLILALRLASIRRWQRGARMTVWERIGRFTAAIFYAAPWAWLICFGTFAAAVARETGHFPSYSNPDPKHVESLARHYIAVVVLLGLALASPVIVAAHVALRAILYPAWPVQWGRLARYALGAALVAYVILGDPAGLSTWLFD
jgi:hypothetical protein